MLANTNHEECVYSCEVFSRKYHGCLNLEANEKKECIQMLIETKENIECRLTLNL